MYEKHFSLKHKPFELTPNPDFLFQSSTHKKAITYLDYGIKERVGFILLTGEVGAGKTTIIRNLVKNLSDSVNLSRVNNTKVSSEQLISMINEDFGLDVEGKSKTRLLSELNSFLVEQYSKNIQPILLIDEAQNLSPDLLEEIRLLSNLETDKAKLIQIILVGQPELKTTLMLPELVQLRQRININYHIAPLSVEEIAAYIKHRLTVAGNPDAIVREDETLRMIHKFSRGIPRLINVLCDFALLTAFVEGSKKVDIDIIREVSKDLETRDYWNGPHDNDTPARTRNEEDDGLSKVAGDLALKVIEIEKITGNIFPEIESLKNRLDEVERKITEFAGTDAANQLGEIVDKISDLENTVAASSKGRAGVIKDNGKSDHFIEQLGSLKKIINDINTKLKRI